MLNSTIFNIFFFLHKVYHLPAQHQRRMLINVHKKLVAS